MKKILITGANGFLGSHLLERSILNKEDIVILTRSKSDLSRIMHLTDRVRSYNIDKDSIESIFMEEKPDIIIHTACSYGRNNEGLFDIIEANLIYGLSLLEQAFKHNVQTFINTDSLLPKNVSNYSLSKSHFSDWLRKYSNRIQVVNLKIEHMYGPNDDKKKFVPWLISQMIDGTGEIRLTSGVQKRDFVYIDDIVDAFDLILKKRENLSTWNQFDVGTYFFMEVKEFVLKIADEIETKYGTKIAHRLNFGALPYRKGDIMVPKVDNKSLLDLGWKPKWSIEEGIREILLKHT